MKTFKAPKYFVDLFDESKDYAKKALEMANATNEVNIDLFDNDISKELNMEMVDKLLKIQKSLVKEKAMLFVKHFELANSLKMQAWARFEINNPNTMASMFKRYDARNQKIIVMGALDNLIDIAKKELKKFGL